MSKEIDLNKVPEGLPAPVDDGSAQHLVGLELPGVCLASSGGNPVALAGLKGKVVIFCYPMTGRPGESLPDGWDQIPGARGCTPQACAYRDNHREFESAGAAVFGVSTQSTEDQKEAATRLSLPYPLLSDEGRQLQNALDLPV
ncbi:MAG: peroxiredoxin, partial [Gemmatimonadaceae bacterium]|nr:peroxiredoxin [Gemmatimonadaceae bacterium]